MIQEPLFQNILWIGTWNSRCGSCGKGADAYELQHDTVIGYYAKDAIIPAGCGEYFTHVATDYIGNPLQNRIKEMRPDLIYIEPFGEPIYGG